MIKARAQYKSKLDFVQVDDFGDPAGDGLFSEAVKGVDGVIHVASVSSEGSPRLSHSHSRSQSDGAIQPLTYDTTDNEKELVLPAINGVRAILKAAAATPSVQRVVITSSFAAVVDLHRQAPPYFTYTGADWNPLTYEEAVDPSSSAVVAYRGAKKFSELEAWDFARASRPHFDLVALCPPMTFGPVRHPVGGVEHLNESNAGLWRIAAGASPLPVARVPFWVDVRDLARAHVEALLRPGAGGSRYIPASPERFSYGLAAEIMEEEFGWAKGTVAREDQAIDESHGVDGETPARELGLQYRPFRQSIVDLIKQAREMSESTSL